MLKNIDNEEKEERCFNVESDRRLKMASGILIYISEAVMRHLINWFKSLFGPVLV